MENQIGDFGAFLKGMQARMDEQHEAVKKSLEANTIVLQELSGWKPKVQADVEELQISVWNLCTKVDQITVKQESAASPAYKVYDTENLDITGATMVSPSTKPYGRLLG